MTDRNERDWLEGGSEGEWLEGRTCTCPALEIGLHGHRRVCPLGPECDCPPSPSGDHTEECRQTGAMADPGPIFDGADPDVVSVRSQPVEEIRGS